ncbi:hypothetical protein FBU59_001299 [Linderina macrospora]|uniref:Uncharacterized protein n=1 Tax=Linderina macrospora TaxID=4868 RepID=A0ACC1JEH1_9FUNG|nr:hypothetical protein FBU59_001299 [Linderina macrospora]
MISENTIKPTPEQPANSTPEELCMYYATNSSINLSLSVASTVRQRTIDMVGDCSVMAIEDY